MSNMKKSFKQREVRITEKFFVTQQITTSDIVTSLGTLGCASGQLFANSASISNLGDMFRLYKVNAAKFRLKYSGINTVTATFMPPALLYVLPFGGAAPAGVSELEADRGLGDLTDQWNAAQTSDSGGIDRTPTLKVRGSDLIVVESASPAGWIATAADADQSHFGTLYLVKAFAGVSTGVTNPYWTLQVEVDISFRDLIDPNLISRTVKPKRAINSPPPESSYPASDSFCVQRCACGVQHQTCVVSGHLKTTAV